MARKTWREKLASGKPREVKPAPRDFADIKAGQVMVLATAEDVADFVRTVPKGRSIDIKALRAGLAERFGAEIACPVVTGIHLRIVAEVAGEELEAGKPASAVVPVWRVVGPGAPIWRKLEHGRDRFAALRKAEGLD